MAAGGGDTPDRTFYGLAGQNIDLLRKDLLVREKVSVAILNGFYYYSAQQGWYEQAAAMASAYNDWQIEHWLEEEPRLRGSVHGRPTSMVGGARGSRVRSARSSRSCDGR